MTRRGTALRHVSEIQSKIGRGYHPGYLALVDDWGDALAVVDAAEAYVDLLLVSKMDTSAVPDAFAELRDALSHYHQSQREST